MKKITIYKPTTADGYKAFKSAKEFMQEHNLEYELIKLTKNAIPKEKMKKFLHFYTSCNSTEILVVTEEEWRLLLMKKWYEKVLEIPEEDRIDFVLDNADEAFRKPIIFMDYYDEQGCLNEEYEGIGTVGFTDFEFGLYIPKSERNYQLKKMINQLSQIDALNKQNANEEKNKEEVEEFNDKYLDELDDNLFEKEFSEQWLTENNQEEHQFSLAI
jgi:arsenate reductase-like glutaredoxin family protein